jgi:hypothetical protein
VITVKYSGNSPGCTQCCTCYLPKKEMNPNRSKSTSDGKELLLIHTSMATFRRHGMSLIMLMYRNLNFGETPNKTYFNSSEK